MAFVRKVKNRYGKYRRRSGRAAYSVTTLVLRSAKNAISARWRKAKGMRSRLQKKHLLTPKQASKQFGMSVATLYRWMKSGLLPSEGTKHMARLVSSADIRKLLP